MQCFVCALKISASFSFVKSCFYIAQIGFRISDAYLGLFQAITTQAFCRVITDDFLFGRNPVKLTPRRFQLVLRPVPVRLKFVHFLIGWARKESRLRNML